MKIISQLSRNYLAIVILLSFFSCKKTDPPQTVSNDSQFIEKSGNNGNNDNQSTSDGFIFQVDQSYDFFVDKADEPLIAYQMTCLLQANGTLNITRTIISTPKDVEYGENMILAAIHTTPFGQDGLKVHYQPAIANRLQLVPFDPNDDIIYPLVGGYSPPIICKCINVNPTNSYTNTCAPTRVLSMSTGQLSVKCSGCPNCEQQEKVMKARLAFDPLNGSDSGASIAIKNIKFTN